MDTHPSKPRVPRSNRGRRATELSGLVRSLYLLLVHNGRTPHQARARISACLTAVRP